MMRAARNLVVVAWIALLAALGVRGLVQDDARYAWGMFDYLLEYRIAYQWRLDDNTTLPFKPGPELKYLRGTLGDSKQMDTMYGLGAVKGDVDAYLGWIAQHAQRPPHARAIEGVLSYKVHLRPEVHTEVVTQELAP